MPYRREQSGDAAISHYHSDFLAIIELQSGGKEPVGIGVGKRGVLEIAIGAKLRHIHSDTDNQHHSHSHEKHLACDAIEIASIERYDSRNSD